MSSSPDPTGAPVPPGADGPVTGAAHVLAGAFLWRTVDGQQEVCLVRRAEGLDLPRVVVTPAEGRREAALRAARELCGWRAGVRTFVGAALEQQGTRRLSTWYWALEPTLREETFAGDAWVRWLSMDEALVHVPGRETRELLLASRPATPTGLGGRFARWRGTDPELGSLAREGVRLAARLEGREADARRTPGGPEALGRAQSALARARAALVAGDVELARVELEGARAFAAPLDSATERTLERVRLRQDVARLGDRDVRARLEEVLDRVDPRDAEAQARLRVEVERARDAARTARARRRAERTGLASLVAVELLALWLLGADPLGLPGALLLGALGGSARALAQDRGDALRATLLGALGGLVAQWLGAAGVLAAGQAGPLVLGVLAARAGVAEDSDRG